MSDGIPVFVYGTLRPGQPGFAELELGGRVDVLGPATVVGTLYDLGDYPGAVLHGCGSILGELLMPRDDGVLALLDSFELFDPANPADSEYLRVPAQTVGNAVTIWIYVYNQQLKEAPIIASGDWISRP